MNYSDTNQMIGKTLHKEYEAQYSSSYESSELQTSVRQAPISLIAVLSAVFATAFIFSQGF